MVPALTAQGAALLRQSGLFDADWYLETHPDVRRIGLDPMRHYCEIGIRLLRDPGPFFNARGYLRAYPDVAAAGVPPVLHYIQAGRAEGRAATPFSHVNPNRSDLQTVSHLRQLLETGGLEDRPLARLEDIANGSGVSAIAACEVLAIWALSDLGVESAKQALFWLDRIESLAGGRSVDRLLPVQMIAAMRAGMPDRAKSIFDTSKGALDLDLAATHLQPHDGWRLACLNAAFGRHGASAQTLVPGAAAAFDRLHAPLVSSSNNTPVVSVLIAAHQAADTLPTALRALQSQTMPDWEAIVIDDASSDQTAEIVTNAAQQDPRIRMLGLAENRGAYGARNAGLEVAKGTFVTLLDADDWCHPQRLERQVAALNDCPWQVGCMTLQARCDNELAITRWTGTGEIAHENLSSLMLPTEIVRDRLGGWDPVRVSADSELLRRVRRLFGDGAVTTLPNSFLGLQRDGTGNATQDTATGMRWFYYGARREYFEAQTAHHAKAAILRYQPGNERPFPAPKGMLSGTQKGVEGFVDRAYAGLFTIYSDGLVSVLDWIKDDLSNGRTVGLVPLYSCDSPAGGGLAIHPALRAMIDGARVRVLCFGETVRCDEYRLAPNQIIPDAQKYLPTLQDGSGPRLWPGAIPSQDSASG